MFVLADNVVLMAEPVIVSVASTSTSVDAALLKVATAGCVAVGVTLRLLADVADVSTVLFRPVTQVLVEAVGVVPPCVLILPADIDTSCVLSNVEKSDVV